MDEGKPQVEEMSLSGSMELLDDDLESASNQITLMLNQAIENSAALLEK